MLRPEKVMRTSGKSEARKKVTRKGWPDGSLRMHRELPGPSWSSPDCSSEYSLKPVELDVVETRLFGICFGFDCSPT